ncbi:MAG: tetratricopeptide repeat protein [Bacteroidetes bacterium]|nr:tetratricopeptide repeat protein [Bacteroidota bacterium]
MNEISYEYRLKQVDSGIAYGRRALALAERVRWKPGVARSYNCIGINYYMMADADSSLKYHQQALDMYRGLGDSAGVGWSLCYLGSVYVNVLNDYPKALSSLEPALQLLSKANDRKGMARTLDILGVAYLDLGQAAKALEHFQKSEKLSESLGDLAATGSSDLHIGNLYTQMGQYPQALDYSKKALTLFKRVGSKVGISSALGSLGEISCVTRKYDEGIDYYRQAAVVDKEIGQKLGVAQDIANIGAAYLLLKKYAEALSAFQESFAIEKALGYKSGMSNCLANMASIYANAPDSFLNRLGKRREIAETTAQEALRLANEIHTISDQKLALETLTSIYAKEKNFENAYRYQRDLVALNDSMVGDEKQKEIAKREVQYQFEKKEDSLRAVQEKRDALASAEIKRQKLIRNYTVSIVLIAGAFSFLMIVFNSRRKKLISDKRVSELEMNALHLQINPHFIFNCMQSINKYMIDNEGKLASQYLIRFSNLMRLTLENSREKEVSLSRDLSALELYMQLEALRFKNKFQYVIEVDPEIDGETTLIPPMLLQPFVENSIIHGISNREGGIIKIIVSKEENMIRCVVEDNGEGRKSSVEHKLSPDVKRESLGVKITQERLEIIGKIKKVATAMFITDLADANNGLSGVRIELLLPFENEF